jgi:uncharacterized protein
MPATVRDNPALSHFELDANGVRAVANYQLDGGVITFTHTEVPPQARAMAASPRSSSKARCGRFGAGA